MAERKPSACLAAVAFTVLATAAAGCDRGPISPGGEHNDERDRALEELDEASVVVREMADTSEIPLARRLKARCVVVVPSLVSGGLVLGAKRGRGVVVCRTKAGWSGPAFVSVTGGSVGLQAGVESADVVMLVMTERGVGQLFRSSFELGGDTSVAAGPVGTEGQASTDAALTAEILSYAHARGLFAGVQLSGAVMKQDRSAAFAAYGGSPDVHAILTGDAPPPREATAFEEQIRRAFPAADPSAQNP
jgi:SH3 domain-containing YSC84-like protein 1